MFRTALILWCAALVALSPPAPAEPREERESAEQLLEGATRQILRALNLMMNAIPQYEMPEVLDNGDIIIRRIPPDPPRPAPEKDVGTDETLT